MVYAYINFLNVIFFKCSIFLALVISPLPKYTTMYIIIFDMFNRYARGGTSLIPYTMEMLIPPSCIIAKACYVVQLVTTDEDLTTD